MRLALQKHYKIAPKAKFIKMGGGANATESRGDEPGPSSAPVFNPYVIDTSDFRLADVGDLSSPPPVSAPPPRGTPPAIPTARPPAPPAMPPVAAGPDPSAEHLASVRTIDDIGEVVMHFVQRDFARVVLLFARGDKLAGWRVEGPGTNADAVRSFTFPIAAVPSLNNVLKQGTPVMTRDPSLLMPFLALVGDPGAAPTVVMPLMHKGKAAACIAAVGGRVDVESRASDYARFSEKVGLAFQLVVLRKQILG
jgi:hypothetical protein